MIERGNRMCWLCRHYNREMKFCWKFDGNTNPFDWCLSGFESRQVGG